MAYDVFVTQAAHEDIEEALEYISTGLANPIASQNLLRHIMDCYQQLREYPMLYEVCRDARLGAMGYRKALVDHFVLIYRIEENAQQVIVLRFLYARRDYKKML